MGLDNGIVFKADIKERPVLEQFLKSLEDKGLFSRRKGCNDYTYIDSISPDEAYSDDIIYMRKWWGVRNHIINNILGTGDEFYTDLTAAAIEDIIDYLKSLNEDNWFDEDYCYSTPWDWEDVKDSIPIKINVLSEVVRFLESLPEDSTITAYFYDSY